MTVHELYQKRLREYENYRVEKGVYDSKVEDGRAALTNAVSELSDVIATIENVDLKQRLERVVNRLCVEQEQITGETLAEVESELNSISFALEQEIRSALQ